MVSRTEKNKKKRKIINKETQKEKREKSLKRIMKIFIIVVIILTCMYVTLRYIGNLGLFVKESSVVSEKLPENFHGIKIIHFTDLHYGTTVDTERLKEIKNKINKLNPDIIIFTGDLVDRHYSITSKEIEEVKILLNEMTAALGKYAVQGNHDKKNFDNIMKDTDFITLDNSYDLIYKDDNNPILITGIGSSTLNNTDIDKAFHYFAEEGSNKDIFTISIMHEPDNIDEIKEKYNVDIALAGHSHNGQVRLPFIPALVKVKGAQKYYEATYTIDNTKLFISGGIGTSKYPFRLFDHPSINLIRLRNH